MSHLEIVRPDQVWCADLTYIRLPNQFGYLAVLMDIFIRSIRGWELEDLAIQVFWDFHYLMNNEITYMQTPIFIPVAFNTVEEERLQAIDAFARLMQQPDENFAQLQTLWETNRDFRLLRGSLV